MERHEGFFNFPYAKRDVVDLPVCFIVSDDVDEGLIHTGLLKGQGLPVRNQPAVDGYEKIGFLFYLGNGGDEFFPGQLPLGGAPAAQKNPVISLLLKLNAFTDQFTGGPGPESWFRGSRRRNGRRKDCILDR